MSLVRDTTGQLSLSIRGAAAAISRPLSPASRSARASWKSASGRADSVARCGDEMRRVGDVSDRSRRRHSCSGPPIRSLERAFECLISQPPPLD